jgi:tetratricopeptide (TPR) repeat protein
MSEAKADNAQRAGGPRRRIVSRPRLPLFIAVTACEILQATGALAHGQGACETSAKQPGITAARAALEKAPQALAPRLNLSDLLVESGCYEEAIHVLEEADKAHPRSADVQKRLRTARSFVSERQFFEGLDKAEAEARLSRNQLRCTRFGDVQACDDALAQKPDDLAIAIAKADALAKQNRLEDALAAYNRAATLSPGNKDIAARIETIQVQRRSLQQRCMTGDGEAALAACQSVLSRDAPDEFDVTRRIAILHQTANQSSRALDAYIAANSLRRGDKSVALAIVALVDSTGRSDAVALAARGSSLVTLGRAREAIASLKQAETLAPGLPDVANLMAAAERLLKQEERMRESQRVAAAAQRPAVAESKSSEGAQGAAAQVAQVAPATATYSNAAPASRSN